MTPPVERFSLLMQGLWWGSLLLGLVCTLAGGWLKKVERLFLVLPLCLAVLSSLLCFQSIPLTSLPLPIPHSVIFFSQGFTPSWFQDFSVCWVWFWSHFFCFLLLFLQYMLFPQDARERFLGASFIASCGTVLTVAAETPWLSLAGISLVTLGGLLSFMPQWTHPAGEALFISLLRERIFGFVLLFLGTCLLEQGGLSFFPASMTPLSPSLQPPNLLLQGGLLLFCFGLLAFVQIFPLTQSNLSPCPFHPLFRLFLHQLLPLWGVFFVFLRLLPLLAAFDLFPYLQIFLLLSLLFVFPMGLVQPHWRMSLSLFLQAGFSLSLLFLLMEGPLLGISFFCGLSLGCLGLCGIGFYLSSAFLTDDHSVQTRTSSSVNRLLFWRGAALAQSFGFFGFLSSVGLLEALARGLEGGHSKWAFPILLLFLVLFFCLGWKIFWQIGLANHKPFEKAQKGPSKPPTEWPVFVYLSSLLLSGLAFWWTGSLLGPHIPFGTHLLFSFLDQAFPSLSPVSTPVWLSASLAAGLFLMAWGISYAFLKQPRQTSSISTTPWKQFVAEGYWLGQLETHFYSIAAEWMRNMARLEKKVFGPHFLWILFLKTLSQLSLPLTGVGQNIFPILARWTQKMTQHTGKALQWVCGGDLRWYLWVAFFCICCMILFST